MYNNIILTGIPRSGSTLSCNLLHSYENTVALLEPMPVFDSDPLSGKIEACRDVQNFFFNSRNKINRESKVITGTIKGKVSTNTFESKNSAGLRKAIIKNEEIVIDKDIEKDFTLVLKHPAFFTSLLDELVYIFQCVATIRNPLSVLASWQTIDVPINRGHVPAAERFDGGLAKLLSSQNDRLSRQFIILNWFFEKYYKNLASDNIIKYEDIIKSDGSVFDKISFNGNSLYEKKLKNKNTNDQYKSVDIDRLYYKLIDQEGFFWKFYSKHEVEVVYEGLKKMQNDSLY